MGGVMRWLSPDAPLWWRLIATALPLCLSATGFAEGSVPAGIAAGAVAALAFHRFFLLGAGD